MAITLSQRRILYQCLKETNAEWAKAYRNGIDKTTAMLIDCIDAAFHSNSDNWWKDVNAVYKKGRLNEFEEFLLQRICMIKHKEHINKRINKEDEEIQEWLKSLKQYREVASKYDDDVEVEEYLDSQVKEIISQYKIQHGTGRPKGSGKQTFTYNGKKYHTIQECADDYGISKQGMYKRLKKLSIIN